MGRVGRLGHSAALFGPALRRRLCALVAGLLLLAPVAAAPDDAWATNAITSGCTVSSTGLTFPNYDLLGQAQVTGSGTLALQCTGTGTVTVHLALSGGVFGSSTCTKRTMTQSSSVLNYNIYTTSALSTILCSGSAKRLAVSVVFPSKTTAETVNQSVTMYGAVTSGQSPPSGSYADTVTATVYWTGGNSPASNVPIQQSAPATCSLSVSSLNFGNYAGVASQAQTSVVATCNSGAPYTIALGGGSNLTGSQRRMGGSTGAYIPYFLYSDSAQSVLWGDGSGLGATVAGTGTGSATTYSVYGATGAQPTIIPGNYSDSVVVTVTY